MTDEYLLGCCMITIRSLALVSGILFGVEGFAVAIAFPDEIVIPLRNPSVDSLKKAQIKKSHVRLSRMEYSVEVTGSPKMTKIITTQYDMEGNATFIVADDRAGYYRVTESGRGISAEVVHQKADQGQKGAK